MMFYRTWCTRRSGIGISGTMTVQWGGWFLLGFLPLYIREMSDGPSQPQSHRSNWLRKLLGLCVHQWDIHSEGPVVDYVGAFCGKYFILRCKHCGDLKIRNLT